MEVVISRRMTDDVGLFHFRWRASAVEHAVLPHMLCLTKSRLANNWAGIYGFTIFEIL